MLEAIAAVTKAVLYGAALSAIGVTFARTTLFAHEDRSLARINDVVRISGFLLSVAACVTTLIYFLRLGGRPDPALLSAIFISPLGVVLVSQIIGGLWLAYAPQSAAALLGALIVLLSFTLIGHANSQGSISSIAVGLHVAAAAWWTGGLWILLFTSRLWNSAGFSALAARFSRQAIRVVAILLAAAIMTAGLLLNFQFDYTAEYQRTLFGKATLTLVLLMVAGINKLVLTPRLTIHLHAQGWLRRAIIVELLLLTGIFAATAVLTTFTSPFQHG